ncbi:MAG: gliding motility-associated C-terminal domain-containing protein, partial [Saprospiraceae bacterium]
KFLIFDRWGSLVYQAEDFLVSDVSKAWKGTFRNEKLNPGVYVWLVQVEFTDGKILNFKGDVTLIR